MIPTTWLDGSVIGLVCAFFCALAGATGGVLFVSSVHVLRAARALVVEEKSGAREEREERSVGEKDGEE